jgi:dTDP-4-dehydrorhamnose 3,5-epimerase
VRFVETQIHGAYAVELEPREDDRGFFARAFSADEFAERGLTTEIAQCNISFNHRKGTIRGLHMQRPPAEEAKLFRCIRGATYHVAVDFRPGSATYGSHVGIELSAESRVAFYIPELCAAGYQALTPDAEVFYMTSAPYSPSSEDGFRYDDPALGIEWPVEVSAISDKDASWPFIKSRSVREPVG